MDLLVSVSETPFNLQPRLGSDQVIRSYDMRLLYHQSRARLGNIEMTIRQMV